MPEQRTDQRQAVPGARERAREAMPQIVKAQATDLGGFAKPPPSVPDVNDMVLAAIAGKNVWLAVGLLAHALGQQLARRCAQRHDMSLVLLGAARRLRPCA